MLQLKKIIKSYKTGDFVQHALREVSVDFRDNEFVAVLGHSGSGKTTMLNIIGGLDRYDSGDLIINGKSTKKFKNTEWDAYRNNSVGFIFQSYNLIGHISVLANVEMGMTLSGISSSERKKKAMEVLERVGLKEHAGKRPNQLSGGQMQRVAIARALANNPDIILADEPTGALDTETSCQIMDLIKEIAKDKLVIMVTHNPELAEQYATRIISLKDGEVLNDTNPPQAEDAEKQEFSLKKTAMSFFTALRLSFNNVMTKKGRTILTSFASSIGIIGIALILALSNGFHKKVEEFESGTMAEFPIVISQETMNVDSEQFNEIAGEHMSDNKDENKYPDVNVIYPYDSVLNTIVHTNKISEEYVDYLEAIDPSTLSGISYIRVLQLNILKNVDGKYGILNSKNINFTSLPQKLGDKNEAGILENNYDLLSGKYPESINDLILIVDMKNRVDKTILEELGFDTELDEINFEDIIGKEFKIVMNDDFYIKPEGMPNFIYNSDFEAMYNSENAITVKISGIVRPKEDSMMTILSPGIAYTNELIEKVSENAKNSEIVKAQEASDKNVLTMQPFDMNTEEGKDAKKNMMLYLGGDSSPYMIMLYPKDFEAKEKVTNYLDAWNDGNNNKIAYTDMAEIVTSLSKNIMDAITIVLIAFSAISLVVSVIMIAIITYISVMERTREIGVLRSLGARRKDITRVFNAETFIIGMCSGLLGIFIACILIIPVNIIIENLSGLPGVASLNPLHAVMLVIISLLLTMLGGLIPAKMAANRDPVLALRAE